MVVSYFPYLFTVQFIGVEYFHFRRFQLIVLGRQFSIQSIHLRLQGTVKHMSHIHKLIEKFMVILQRKLRNGIYNTTV